MGRVNLDNTILVLSKHLMDIEEIFQSYLEKGWRLHLKTHAAHKTMIPAEERDRWTKLDETDVVGWLCDAYSYGSVRKALHPDHNYIHGAVTPTLEEAITYTLEKIDQASKWALGEK